MTVDFEGKKYKPGTYAKPRPSAADLADNFILEPDKHRLKTKNELPGPELYPSICFSRKIGVGALEIADLLADKIGYHVVDREIVEHIADRAELSEKAVDTFDERYPGEIQEFFTMAFGEKSFISSDYNKHLFSVAYAMLH